MTEEEHLTAIATAQVNNTLHARNALVSLWIAGHHIETLFGQMMSPSEVAGRAGISLIQVYAALTVRKTYAHVRDIPA